ncbi:MAG: glycosyltransferase family 9 protein, partial [Planctomycetota bacterium]|nr:glycosyltransferase family 9 protein [Planctomycetota bacterium]
ARSPAITSSDRTAGEPGAPTLADLEALRGPHPGEFLPDLGPPTRFDGLAEPRRILVSLPGWVGDVVMATPALRALRRRFPDAHVVAHGKRHLLTLLEGSPLVDEFLPSPARGARATLIAARELRALRFDWAVLLAESERAALLARLAGIPLRAGLFHTSPRRWLLSHPVPRVRSASGRLARFSMIERYLRVTRARGAREEGDQMELPLLERTKAAVAQRLDAAGVDPHGAMVVVVPGAAFGAAKTWLPDRFGAAARELCGRLGARAVLAPGPGEERLASEVVGHASLAAVSLDAPCLDLAELTALVDRATVVVTNDTGPRSIAVARRRPTVVVAGPTDQAYTAHHLQDQRVLTADVSCRPCHRSVCPIDHRCMSGVPVSGVVDAAMDLVEG